MTVRGAFVFVLPCRVTTVVSAFTAALPAWWRRHGQADDDAVRSLIEGDSTTRSGLDVLGTGSSPSTVTAICWVAVHPPGSVALTETIAAPARTGVGVKAVPETLALTTPTSLETAAYVSRSPSGSVGYGTTSIVDVTGPIVSACSGVAPEIEGERFAATWTRVGAAGDALSPQLDARSRPREVSP